VSVKRERLPIASNVQPLIGCAGWSIPRAERSEFPGDGSHLARYAAQLPATEINSSFHGAHQLATYHRWRESVPADFRFSAKVPKAITHTQRLIGTAELMNTFLAEVSSLQEKLGCLLVQFPPSFSFDAVVADQFFEELRKLTRIAVACEPRHASWFSKEANAVLQEHEVARVAADPARHPGAEEPGGWRGLSYYRLHGSPRMYYSAYTTDFIASLAGRLRDDLRAGRELWCIFDNTTLGAATRNALDLASIFASDRTVGGEHGR
jgi:uncharacterized protein YecE (DUF72 family)